MHFVQNLIFFKKKYEATSTSKWFWSYDSLKIAHRIWCHMASLELKGFTQTVVQERQLKLEIRKKLFLKISRNSCNTVNEVILFLNFFWQFAARKGDSVKIVKVCRKIIIHSSINSFYKKKECCAYWLRINYGRGKECTEGDDTS